MNVAAASDEAVNRFHATLRFAAGVTAAFVLGELLQWTPTFVAGVLASALLGNLPGRPSLKVTISLTLVMALSGLSAYVLASLFRGIPAVLYGLVALVLFLAFEAIHSGKPRLPAILLMVCMSVIPVVMMVAPGSGFILPRALTRGIIVALVMVWIVYAIWPRTAPPKPPPPAPQAMTPMVTALISTAVVMPVLLVYLMFGFADVLPVLIGTVLLAADFDPSVSRINAFYRVMANFFGGLAGLSIYFLSHSTPNLFFLGTLLFLAMLAFGKYIAAAGPHASMAAVACNATLIILGTALTNGSGPLSLWLIRVFQFSLAGAFIIGMMSLLWHFVSDRHAAHAPAPDP